MGDSNTIKLDLLIFVENAHYHEAEPPYIYPHVTQWVISYVQCNTICKESEEEVRGKNGFSLMEMMVVLLIMSIIAAATAPIVSKKMTKSASGTSASPWVFTGEGKNIAYNMGGLSNATAIIGAAKVPSGTNARLYIDCGSDAAQIALGNGDTAANILADPVGKRVGFFSASSNVNVPDNSIAIGMNQSLGGSDIVSIGSSASATHQYSTALGSSSAASNNYSTALGYLAQAAGVSSIATGYNSQASAENSIAIGKNSESTTSSAIAIGNSAKASKTNAISIGNNAQAKDNNTIAIGLNTNTFLRSIAIGVRLTHLVIVP